MIVVMKCDKYLGTCKQYEDILEILKIDTVKHFFATFISFLSKLKKNKFIN